LKNILVQGIIALLFIHTTHLTDTVFIAHKNSIPSGGRVAVVRSYSDNGRRMDPSRGLIRCYGLRLVALCGAREKPESCHARVLGVLRT